MVVGAFVPTPITFESNKIRPNLNLSATSRRDMLQFVSLATFGTAVWAPPAFAERSLGTVTESYKRYVPRMEAGFAFLAKDLKEMIDRDDINGVVAEITADKGTTLSAMKGTMKVSERTRVVSGRFSRVRKVACSHVLITTGRSLPLRFQTRCSASLQENCNWRHRRQVMNSTRLPIP